MSDTERVLREMLEEWETHQRKTALTAALAALDRFANVDDDAALFRTEPDGRVTVVHCVPERDYLCTGELLISIATEANQWLEDRARLREALAQARAAVSCIPARVDDAQRHRPPWGAGDGRKFYEALETIDGLAREARRQIDVALSRRAAGAV